MSVRNTPYLFEYKRGNLFYTKVSFNEFTGNITFHDTRYPGGTPQPVKEAFLAEADAAVMLRLMKMDADDGGGLGPWQKGEY